MFGTIVSISTLFQKEKTLVFVSLNSSNLEALDQVYTQTQDDIANLSDKY